MTAISSPSSARPSRGLNVTLWVVQALMSVFFLVAASGPKLFGQHTAVDMFTQIGAGQWLRYFVGACELAGAIGLLIKPLSGLASIGLTLLMIGATITQVFVIHGGAAIATPAILAVVFALLAWARRAETATLLHHHN